MTEPQTPATPYEVVIPDHLMERISNLAPEEFDSLAATIAQLREDPTQAANARPVIPHPLAPGRPAVYVPATRSVSYLRNAVADISPPTVADFDTELREDVTGDDSYARIRSMRAFILRWIEYIALAGDPDVERELSQATDGSDYAARFNDVMTRLRRREFPDARGGDLAVFTEPWRDGYRAVCPITMIRTTGPTADHAHDAMRGALTELITGY